MTSYQKLDIVVKKYQAGIPEAANQLVETFAGFLRRYLDLIHKGRYNLSDRMTREFIGLYLRDPDIRKHLHQWERMPSIKHEITQVADSLYPMFMSFEEEEINNELQAALLLLAKRYKPYISEKPYFHVYIRKSFGYQIKRQLALLIKDPITYRMSNASSFDDDVIMIVDLDKLFEDTHNKNYPYVLINDAFEEEIGDNWINGHTASDLFLQLSKLERRILKLYYEDKKSDQQIAAITGTCRATINRRRLAAKRKIANDLRENHLLQEVRDSCSI